MSDVFFLFSSFYQHISSASVIRRPQISPSSLSDCSIVSSFLRSWLSLHLRFLFVIFFPPSPSLSLWCFVSLSVSFFDIIFRLCAFPFVSLSIFMTRPRQPQQVYFSGLLSVSKALKMNYWTDWPLAAQLMFGCASVSFLCFHISSLSPFMSVCVSEQSRPFFTCVYGAAVLVCWAVRNVSPRFESLLLVLRLSNPVRFVWSVCLCALT